MYFQVAWVKIHRNAFVTLPLWAHSPRLCSWLRGAWRVATRSANNAGVAKLVGVTMNEDDIDATKAEG